jgi:hypothetical protein
MNEKLGGWGGTKGGRVAGAGWIFPIDKKESCDFPWFRRFCKRPFLVHISLRRHKGGWGLGWDWVGLEDQSRAGGNEYEWTGG